MSDPVEPLDTPELVIALHCSGAGPGQWQRLADELGSRFELVAPEHYGGDNRGPWTGVHAFSLADEAQATMALIDGSDRRIHVVGHSYGGALALHVALKRPDRIASLALYEPSAFHLLRQFGEDGAPGLAEIEALGGETSARIRAGDRRGAAAAFVNYWSGPQAWDAMKPEAQAALVRWVPKAPLDFGALLEEPTLARAYKDLRVATLVIRGEHAPIPSRIIAETLPSLLPRASRQVIAGAGHMGPLTHASAVNTAIARHLLSHRSQRRPPLPSRHAD